MYADDKRYLRGIARDREWGSAGKVEDRTPIHRTCSCGKTVTHSKGRPVILDGSPVSCPRECE